MSSNEEYLDCHYMFNRPRPRAVVDMEIKLNKIEKYLYSNKDNISKKVYDDLLNILFSRRS